ncbi:MAG: hypothetical protein RIC56_16700 [Pseudomonadales bacterium]
MLFALMGVSGLRADVADVLLCLDETDAARRLACYDAAARALRAAPGGTGERSAELPAAVANESRQRERVRREGRADGTTATVERVEVTALGRRLLTLSNGERWLEVEADRDPVAPGEHVVVTARTFRTVMRLESGGVLTVRPAP